MKKKVTSLITIILFLVVSCNGNNPSSSITTSSSTSSASSSVSSTYVETGKNIIENNTSVYSIVKSKTANSANDYAATELQNYISLSTGVTLPIISDEGLTYSDDLKVISIGKTKVFETSAIEVDYEALNGDGFIIKTKGASIFIEAGNDRGILYGSYDFVEKFLGVRFFSYDSTKIPSHSVLPLYNLDIVEIPAFPMRSYLDGVNYMAWTNQDFAVKLRTNSNYALFDQKHGGSSSMYGRYNDHNFALYVPYETYGQTHPEFYITDSRYPWRSIDITNGLTDDGKIDETMDVSVIKVAIAEMIKDVKARPEVDYFVFEQEDGDIYCRTEKCNEVASKYTRSGMMVRFVNLLADEVQKWADEYYKDQGGRDIKIVTFAYAYTAQAPLKIVNNELVPIDDTVKVSDNVVIRLALFPNGFYDYFDLDNQKTSVTTSLANWKKLANKFMFWGYDIAYENYMAYYPSFQTISNNVQNFEDYGLEYLMIQSSHNTVNNWQSRMRAYLYSKLMWNPDQDVSKLMDEYIQFYYGEESAAAVYEFLRIYDEYYAFLLKNNPNIVVGTLSDYYGPLFVPIEIHEAAYNTIEAAIHEVENNDSLTVEMRNQYLVRLTQILTTPMASILKFYNEYYLMASALDKQNYARKFFEYAEFAGIDTYSEGYSINDYKKILGF